MNRTKCRMRFFAFTPENDASDGFFAQLNKTKNAKYSTEYAIDISFHAFYTKSAELLEESMKVTLCAFADEAGSRLSEQIAALKRNGIGMVELRSVNGKNIADFSEDEARQISKELEREGIQVWALGSPIGKVKVEDNFEAECERLKRLMRIGKIFKTKRIRVFSFYCGDNPDGFAAEVTERMRKMIKIAAEEGFSLYHENEKEIFGDIADRVLLLYRESEGLHMVFDPANYVQCGQDMGQAYREIYPLCDYFHIKDALYGSGEVVPSGKGDGEVRRLVSLLDKDTVFSVEPHLAIFDGYSETSNSELKCRYVYKSNADAFDAAVSALKTILAEQGYSENEGEWIK